MRKKLHFEPTSKRPYVFQIIDETGKVVVRFESNDLEQARRLADQWLKRQWKE